MKRTGHFWVKLKTWDIAACYNGEFYIPGYEKRYQENDPMVVEWGDQIFREENLDKIQLEILKAENNKLRQEIKKLKENLVINTPEKLADAIDKAFGSSFSNFLGIKTGKTDK